jgi:predicted TIM-barrel fold metal-dependent hydrolase
MDDLPIIDAHHHLWDLARNHYPWLTGEPKHGTFLGDYSAIKHTYMPEDFRRDSAGFRVVATVHVEAEMDRSDQVGETAWLHEVHARYGMPNAVVGHVWFTDPACEEKLAAHCRFPLMRGIRSKPVTADRPGERVRGKHGTMQDPAWLAGFALLEKFGLSWDLRVPLWHLEEAAEGQRTFRASRSCSTTPAFRGTAARRGLPTGPRAWKRWRAAPMSM